MMSAGPTYWPTLPEATVEIITLGTPTGRARIAGVASAVPPEPPAEMMPATPSCRRIQRSNASVIAATDAPRSPVKTPAAPRGCQAAISVGGTSAPEGLPEVERSTRRTGSPCSFRMSRTNLSSAPLVSRVPATSTTGRPVAVSGRACGSSRRRASVTVRAFRSSTRTGTGCDQRVGVCGFDR